MPAVVNSQEGGELYWVAQGALSNRREASKEGSGMPANREGLFFWGMALPNHSAVVLDVSSAGHTAVERLQLALSRWRALSYSVAKVGNGI